MDTIGKRIAAYRKKKNIKQDELAEILGVSPQAVSKWENDISCPDISLLSTLSGLLCVSIDEIITGKRYYPCACNIEELDSKTFTLLFEIDGVECSKMNIPMSRVRKAVEKRLDPIILADCKQAFNYVDFAAVINLVVGISETGQTGILFECSDGKAKAKFIEE